MNKKLRQRVIASVLAVVMVLSLLPMQFLGGAVEVLAATAYSLSANDVGVFDALTETQTAGTENYFTLLTSVKGTSSTKTYDGMDFTSRIQTAGAMSTTQKAIAFTTNAAASVKVIAQQSGGNAGDIRHVGIMDSTGANIATSPDLVKGTTADPFTLEVPSAGTYYIGGIENGIDIYYIAVTEGAAGSEEPTTEAPTEEPTSEAPTEAPTVEEPTSEAPTVEEPTSEAPTEEPTSEAPTEEPTSEAPTDAPTEAPAAGLTFESYKWDFCTTYDALQGANGLGTFDADPENEGTYDVLAVDATASGAKLSPNNGNGSQFNAGTILTVPVKGDCKITVNMYPGYGPSYTIADQSVDAKTDTYEYYYTGAAGTVAITATGNGYINDVSVEYPLVYKWDFCTTFDAIQNGTGTFDADSENEGTYDILAVDATASGAKLSPNGGNGSQFNTGTILTVPVAEDCKITVNMYPGYGPSYTIADQSVDAKVDTYDYYYTGEAGTVVITATGNGYINDVVVTYGAAAPAEEVTVDVTGTVTGSASEGVVPESGVEGGTLVFTDENAKKTKATIATDGTYTVALAIGHTYTVAIEGVDYTLEDTLDLTAVTENTTKDLVAAYVEPPKTTDMSPTENPRPTIVKSYKVGYEGESGSYEKTATNGFVINGGGEYFGKDTMIDSLYTAGFAVPDGSVVTLTAKLTPSVAEGVTTGMLGAFGKEDITEPDSYAYGMYWDVKTGFMRVGRHGGAGNTVVTLNDSVYIKMECIESAGGLYYTIASDASFSEESIIKSRSGMGCDTCSPNYVGFFATEGTTLTVEDIEITAVYTEEGATTQTKKMVYSSAYGELMPTFTDSVATGGSSVADFSFTSTVDGNELNLVSTRGGSAKGDIRSNKGVNYLLFPKTTENWTIQTDVLINSLNNGTDKQGVAIGVTGMYGDGTKLCGSWFQANKNLVMQHNYNNDGSANGGNPKSAAVIDIDSTDGGVTYTMSYKKVGAGDYTYGTGEDAVTNNYPVGYALMNAIDASGTQVVDGSAYPFDYTNGSVNYQDGAEVQYALAVCATDVVVSNLKLTNADGYIIYDMNDYYIVNGVAPVVAEVTAEAREDRTAIDLAWTLDPSVEGKGNVKYLVQVSVDGGEYTKAGESKVCSFTYPVKATGEYKFKVWAVSGESSSTDQAKESAVVSVLMPLTKPVLTATGDADSVALSWTLSSGATAYDVYRAVGSDGEFTVLTTVEAPADAEATAATYDDTTAASEEPVYYYIVAKCDGNTSNPSDTMQALVSAGHDYGYLVGTDADDLTITSKTNDTFFSEDKTFEVKGSYAVAGSAVVVINGVAGEAVECAAGAEVAFAGVLEDGRNDVEIIFTNADGKKSREIFNFVVNPHYDILVDAAFTGTDGEGDVPTYKTIGAALATIPADNAKQKVIFVKNGNYEERVVVTAPNVSILGEDKALTKQYAAVAVYDKTATGMWDRNAMYVDSTADNFTLENIWVENSFAYTNGSDQQADALAIVADNVLVINVNLIGYQDTLLVDSRVKDSTGGYEVTNQYFKKCYITGNVDFIYGGGSAVFEDCDVVGRYTSYKADGCFTAARTYNYVEYGLIFNNCRFWSEAEIAAGAYRLARPWGADASTVFLNSYMDDSILAVGYGDMSGNSYKNARFAEYNSSGAGYAVNNDRPLLTSAQAEKYATATVLGSDFAYETIMANMYSVPAVTYTVTVTADENGTASANVTEAAEGDTVTLTATPNEGYEFDGWVVIAGDVVITDNTFVMPATAVEIKATFVDPNPPVVDPVQAFVERMYTVALGRTADEAGVANWVGVLKDGSFDGAAIAQNFILGDEFKLNNNSNEQFVDILYATFFDRAADEAGKAFWMDVLAQGNSREFVLSNFVNSEEFSIVCGSYGIQRGVMFEDGSVSNPGVVQFVNRLYSLVMGRAADKDGLYIWVLSLTVKAETAESAAKFFFNSDEYALKNTDDATYVTDLYAVFMNREADADGLKFWTDTIAVGMTREEVLSEFAKSQEFANIAASYGLQ